MKTTAVRLYGKNDLRLESFVLPAIKHNEILAKVVTDSLCVSSYKACSLGMDHARIPNDVAENPIILGHEFCGEILEVGEKWRSLFSKHEKFVIQPALNYKGSLDAPGYSFPFIGGNATYIVIPNIVMEQNCLLKYKGKAYYQGSLSEPLSCVIGTCHAMYHVLQGTYVHDMGIKERGSLALLAGTGPMGLAIINYCIHGPRKPALMVVTSRNKEKLARAKILFPPEDAEKQGVRLKYLYADDKKHSTNTLLNIESSGYNDVIVMASSKSLVETADNVLSKDGCLNFFAGPTDTEFSTLVNFYNVHYKGTHLASNSGGNTDDMIEALALMHKKTIRPEAMISHIGGLNCVIDTTKNLPNISGSKKLIYTHKNIPLTAIESLASIADGEQINRPTLQEGTQISKGFYADLASITETNNGLWSEEAEQYLLENAPDLE